MRSGSDAKGISPSPAQPLLTFAKLFEFARFLFEKVMTTMDTLMKVPRFAPLKKLALRAGQAARGHLSSEEIAAYLSGNVSRGERKLIEFHLAVCERCRKLIAEIEKSMLAVKDVDES